MRVRFGQFSESPVLAAARALGLDTEAGIEIETVRVPSSPAQFASLRDGEFDIAITSPDNVLLYATTDATPLGAALPLRMLRAIDHGLGLALVARPGVDPGTVPVAVDVQRSGFAILLRRLLRETGTDPATVDFIELGSTPKRLEHLLAGDAGATILNAESRVAGEAAGLEVRAVAAEVVPGYLGTVLACLDSTADELLGPTLAMWDAAAAWLGTASLAELGERLAPIAPRLAEPGYLRILRDPNEGLVGDTRITAGQLEVLAGLRRDAGAYAPGEDALRGLASG